MSILQENKKVAMCSDHAGFELKSIIQGYLEAQDVEYVDFGTNSADSCDYPDFAHPCADAVESGKCYPGIAMCGSGNGISMTLNKHQGVRAALCADSLSASLTRQHNNANVLVLGAGIVGPNLALNIVDTFLTTDFSGDERHQRRIDLIEG